MARFIRFPREASERLLRLIETYEVASAIFADEELARTSLVAFNIAETEFYQGVEDLILSFREGPTSD